MFASASLLAGEMLPVLSSRCVRENEREVQRRKGSLPALRLQQLTTGVERDAMGNYFLPGIESVAKPGANKITARAIPTNERRWASQFRAIRIRPLTAVSSRKSIESAKSDTEPIARAMANSTPK